MSYMIGGGNPQKFALVSQVLTNSDNGSPTTGGWYVYPINTEEYDPYNLLTLSSNQITLEKGKYYMEGHLTMMRCDGSSTRLYNVSDSVEELPGQPLFPTNEGISYSISGIIDISSQKIFRMEYNVQTAYGGRGLGISGNHTGTDRYLSLKFTLIG